MKAPLNVTRIDCRAAALGLACRPDLAYIARSFIPERLMPIRTATLNHQIQKNGAMLHRAMMSRTLSQGVDAPPSEPEQALLEERRKLKQARAQRQVQAKQPKPKAAKVVKEAKAPKAPKAPKAQKEPKPAKDAKNAKGAKTHHPSRAEKQVIKAESLAAAKKAARKSAKT